MANYKGENENILDLFFRYGFAINNIEIMIKYAQTDKGDLLANINSTSKLDKIITSGYFTFAEYYNMIEQLITLKNNQQLAYLRSLPLPIRKLSTNTHLFERLIKRYIGISANSSQMKQDLLVFDNLVAIYTNIVSDREHLYNFIYDNYEISDLNSNIYGRILGLTEDLENIFISDNLKIFKTIPTLRGKYFIIKGRLLNILSIIILISY